MFRTISLFFGAPLAAVFAFPADAGANDAVFNGIKGVLISQVDPDAIEMARFSISRPSEAAIVYSRAAAQDYPFFALVGAVKAAKDRDFPQIGIFTYDKCMTPITAIDTVFASASSTIDDAQAQASTNAAMATASGIAAEYAKAESDAAKAKLVEQLAESVPYFGDIPTICAFAFETELQAERNLNLVASQLAQDVRTAYVAFVSGDVVTGAAVLITLGAGKEVVCSMVDSAVAGGAIGRTPLLGTLAKEACSGFVGTVLDGVTGIVKGGVGAIEYGVQALGSGAKAVGCAVYSLIGSGCSSAPAPPTVEESGNAWCAPYGGVRDFAITPNQPDDFMLVCNDNSQCKSSPGIAVQCATGAEIAARLAQQLAAVEAEFQVRTPIWQGEFEARWLPKCVDEACKTGIRVVRLNAVLRAKQEHEAQPALPFATVTNYPFEAADRQAVTVIDELDYRVRPAKWADNFRWRWNDRCQDNQCRAGVQFIAANAQLQVQQRGAASPRPPYGGTTPIYAAAEAQGASLIVEGVQRAVEFNKSNTANAAMAWELLTNGIWGKQCADVACMVQVKQLSAQMRIASNLVQLADPEASSMSVQGKVAQEYGPKFKAAVVASQERATAQVPSVAAFPARAVGPIEPFMQKRSFDTPTRRSTQRTRRLTPLPGPVVRPDPVRPPGPIVLPVPVERTAASVSMQAGTDRMGGDYRGFALDRADPEMCRQACADEAMCRAYTYVNAGLKGPQAMCFLKSSVPPANADGCCTSGEKAIAPGR